jgi:ATP-dependent DNA ligase
MKLVLAKPIEQSPPDVIEMLEKSRRLIIERKRNGHSTLITLAGTRPGDVGIYSRSIQVLADKFPHHVEAVRSLSVPAGTLLQAENVMADKSGIERSGLITRFAGSGAERAIALQAELGLSTFAFFNILVHKYESIAHWPYRDRLALLRELLAKNQNPALELVEVLDGSLAERKKQSLAQKWEGLVLYDAEASTEFRVDGNHDRPPRPFGCWKWKDYLEGDFVATGWIPSTSKRNLGLVKDLEIAQYDPQSGELVHWGKVGIGLTQKERHEYTDNSLYPMVFEVQFESRTPNNRLTLAQILRRRFDKAPTECFSPA